jgi:hypothetical protein
VVLTLITALRSSGYWRTLSSVNARSPKIRMNRLTTIARTGLLMKMSVNFIARAFGGWASFYVVAGEMRLCSSFPRRRESMDVDFDRLEVHGSPPSRG